MHSGDHVIRQTTNQAWRLQRPVGASRYIGQYWAQSIAYLMPAKCKTAEAIICLTVS